MSDGSVIRAFSPQGSDTSKSGFDVGAFMLVRGKGRMLLST